MMQYPSAVRRRLVIAGLLAVVPASVSLAARQAQSASQQPAMPVFRVNTAGVIVDVVVRDRSGRPVTDLTKDDFTVFENDSAQTITSFRLVGSGDDRGTSDRASVNDVAKSTSVTEAPRLVAVVFDRLSQEARLRAYRAARSYVDEVSRTGQRTGVFSLDHSLSVVQEYTRDRALLHTALDRVARRATAPFAVHTTFSQASSSAADPRGIPKSPDTTLRIPDMEDLERAMARAFEALERDHAGYASTTGLLAIIHALRHVPGRKTLVLFSEGLEIPLAVQHDFDSVIDAANRANVAVYTFDAAGLRVRSPLDETRTLIQNGQYTREGIVDVLARNPEIALTILASETGGVAVHDTNDLNPGLRRMAEDSGSHYLLGYNPTNQVFDGKFRRIRVAVKRRDLDVRARRGYTAVRDVPAAPVLVYEARPLAILDGSTVPNAFQVDAATFSFPEPNRPGLTPLFVGFRNAVLTFEEDKTRNRYRAEFTVLARLLADDGTVVRKLSQHYELAGPLAQMEEVKRGEVVFYRQPELAPGVYQLETIVYDSLADRASVRLATLEVPARATTESRVSSLMLVQRAERVPADKRDPNNPLYQGDVWLCPRIGEPFRKGSDAEVSFYLVIYPSAGAAAPASTLQLLQNGNLLAQAPVQLPVPDASGRIQYIGRLPLDNLTPGSYELRLTVNDAKSKQTRTALFRIE